MKKRKEREQAFFLFFLAYDFNIHPCSDCLLRKKRHNYLLRKSKYVANFLRRTKYV